MEYRSESTRWSAGKAPEEIGGRVSGWIERAVALAARAAERPYHSTLALIALNLLAIGLLVGVGELLFVDRAELFRELMPGTWLSVAQLGFIAAAAWAIHLRVLPGSRLRLNSFWGMSVVVFTVLALDEATQLTIFAADVLKAAGTVAPAGFEDLDAFLLTVLLLAGGAALVRFGSTLLSHPTAMALMAIGVALGAASQLLDSTLAVTPSEIVAEESLKLMAEPFVIGGYLVVLYRLNRRSNRA